MRPWIRTAIAMALLGLSGAGARADMSFQLLQSPAAPSWENYSLSSDGMTVACNFGGAIYLWTEADGFTPLGPGHFLSSSIGISGDGSAVCASQLAPDGNVNPALWTEETGWMDLGYPEDACVMDGNWGSGYAVSGDGSIAVGLSWYCPGAQGFKWTSAGGIVGLGHPEGASSRASDISDDGSTIVGFYEHPDYGFRRPVRWLSDGTPDLFLGTENPGEATATSSDGSRIVGEYAITTSHAFHYTEAGGLVELGTLSGLEFDRSIANGVSDDGQVVGWSGDPFWGVAEAFRWTSESGMHSLRGYLVGMGADIPEELFLTNALAISADGSTIIGTYLDVNTYAMGGWIARFDGVTPVFMSDFRVEPRGATVEISFQVQAQAFPDQFELIATNGVATWSVPVEVGDRGFRGSDRSPHLASRGEVTYRLYYLGDGARELLRSEVVRLGGDPVASGLAARPNPFTPETSITFTLPRAQQASLSIFDVEGRRVADLSTGWLEAGEHSIAWRGTDDGGRAVASGIYLVILQSEDGLEIERVTVLR